MSLANYVPAASGAQGLSRTFPTAQEPVFAAANARFPTAQFNYKPICDELLGLIANTYESGTTQRRGLKNRIINGGFDIAQRGTSFTSVTTFLNSNDLYTLDRWYVLSDGNDIIDVTQNTATVPTNGKNAIALDVETVNKKFGIAQIIQGADCKGLIGNTVTLSFKAKVSSTTKLDNVKCAIVAWSGTEDTVTSNIISAWGVEGTNPTLIANATYENTPANLSLTTSYATYSVSAAVDTASAKNVIVFIWSDVTDTTLGDFLYITDVQLEPGATATAFEFHPYSQEQDRCRYFWRKIGGSASAVKLAVGQCYTTANIETFIRFDSPMRALPAVDYKGTEFESYTAAGSNQAMGNPSIGTVTPEGFHFVLVASSGTPFTAGHASNIRVSDSASFFTIDSEL